jgi:hypothetical protein
MIPQLEGPAGHVGDTTGHHMGHHFAEMGHQMGHYSAQMGHQRTPFWPNGTLNGTPNLTRWDIKWDTILPKWDTKGHQRTPFWCPTSLLLTYGAEEGSLRGFWRPSG